MAVAGGQGYDPIREGFYIAPDSACYYNQREMLRESTSYFSSLDEFRMENGRKSQRWKAGVGGCEEVRGR